MLNEYDQYDPALANKTKPSTQQLNFMLLCVMYFQIMIWNLTNI